MSRHSETAFIVEAAAVAKRAGSQPSAEEMVCDYLAERGIYEPPSTSALVTPQSMLFYREWSRLCTLIIEEAKL